jgi:glutamate 5-kinase
MIGADLLILLSDVDGLYNADPRLHKEARIVEEVRDVSDDIMAMAGEARTDVGRGGMITKLMAGRIAMGAGCNMVIAQGQISRPLKAITEGRPCTWFLSATSPRAARKQWIAASLTPKGAIVVDEGAARALAAGKSLLPAGVRAVEGAFERGDPVIVRDSSGSELGRGISAYSHEDARLILGHKSREIEDLLGYRGRDEMIHRDDLALTSFAGRTARTAATEKETGSGPRSGNGMEKAQ